MRMLWGLSGGVSQTTRLALVPGRLVEGGVGHVIVELTTDLLCAEEPVGGERLERVLGGAHREPEDFRGSLCGRRSVASEECENRVLRGGRASWIGDGEGTLNLESQGFSLFHQRRDPVHTLADSVVKRLACALVNPSLIGKAVEPLKERVLGDVTFEGQCGRGRIGAPATASTGFQSSRIPEQGQAEREQPAHPLGMHVHPHGLGRHRRVGVMATKAM